MSRLIVKNLPKNINEDKIREIFCKNGTITDIQLKYTPEGKFRQFGFIGYQQESEADAAIKDLNNIFINTTKITVEKCALLGDANKPKAWSKYTSESTAFKKSNKKETEVIVAKEKPVKVDKKKELLEKYKNDDTFKDFLLLNAPNEVKNLESLEKETSKKLESDESAYSSEIDEDAEDKDKLANKDISDLEYMKNLQGKSDDVDPEMPQKGRQKTEKKIREKIELFTVKLRDLPYNCKKKEIKQFFKPNNPYSIRIPRKIHGIAYAGFKTEKAFNKALQKDHSFINGKRISVSKYINENNTEKEEVGNMRKHKWKNQEEALKNEEDIGESGRIFIRNLSYTTKEEDIEGLFGKFGPISEISLPIDSMSKKIKGFGVVTFLMPEHAVSAYSELDGSVLHGRMLHLLPAKSKDTEAADKLEESSNFKLKKAAKQKSQAGLSHNWNALFLGADAVAEVIADTFGTTKEQVVGPENDGSAAVRLALGETQIVAQTRKYLEEHGVILDTFSSPLSKRSKNIILVKNLPAKTEIKEIRLLFEKYGDLGRVILPPSGITAIVEFFEAAEAKKAFTCLAYSKFKNVPLYLEWAPAESLSSQAFEKIKKLKEMEVAEPAEDSSKTNEQVEVQPDQEEEEEDEPEPDATLFVKNLNFKTTDEGLHEHFKKCGKISYATVATKKDISNPNGKLSMGYGFVRFMTKDSADKALKTLQQSVLDGKSLELKRSERVLSNDVVKVKKTTKKTKQNGTKLLVRNVPFQANKRELQELFSTFGEIKALRLPKKFSSADSHRGFAFVDFVTSSDAKSAFDALSQSTHLYGRRLVIEWASIDEENVDEMRKKTASLFGSEVQTKKTKKGVLNID